MKSILVAVCTFLTVGLFATPVAAQEDGAYPPRVMLISVSDSTPESGEPFEVTVKGCEPEERVVFSFQGDTKTVTCKSDGTAQGLNGGFAPVLALTGFNAPPSEGSYGGTAVVVIAGRPYEIGFDVTVEGQQVSEAAMALPVQPLSSNVWRTIFIMTLIFAVSSALCGGLWFAFNRED